MVSIARVSGWALLGGLMAAAQFGASVGQAQSTGPSTTGGALPYITGTQKPASANEPAEPKPPVATAPTREPSTATPNGVRVIDLSKREPSEPNGRPVPPPPERVTTSPAAPADQPRVIATPEVAKPAGGADVFTPVAPPGSDMIAGTPPSVEPSAVASAPTPPKALAAAPKPKAKPKPKATAAKPTPRQRSAPTTARLERQPPADIEIYDQDVEIEIEAPRPMRTERRGRFAGYDAWGRPVYYMPNTPARDRRWPRAPRFVDEDWIEPPPRPLRRLPPVGYLRPFPPGSFRGENCRVVFETDETGFTRREMRCR